VLPGGDQGRGGVDAARQRALAVGFANGGSAFGAVLAPPLTVWWTGMFGWRGAFIATAVLGLLWLIGLATGVPRAAATAATAPPAQRSAGFKALLARPEVRRFMLARFFFDPVFYFYMFWIPQYLSRERGLSLAEIGNLTWIPFFALGVTNIAAGRVSDMLVRAATRRRARMSLMLLAALLTPASWLASTAGTAGRGHRADVGADVRPRHLDRQLHHADRRHVDSTEVGTAVG
jgi:MFS transporter, ACS family, hexuronate transporter